MNSINKYTLLIISGIIMVLYSHYSCAQMDTYSQNNELPYKTIGEYPPSFAGHTVVARMIDGLGYRYHWATEQLTDTVLVYKPSPTNRNVMETLIHLADLSDGILAVVSGQTLPTGASYDDLSYEKLRRVTLEMLEEAAGLCLSSSDQEMSNLNMKIVRSADTTSYPIWHLINGQISDALYHVGQVVAYRRAAGLPLDPRVSVFIGKNKD